MKATGRNWQAVCIVTILLCMTLETGNCKMMRKQVNMGIVDPYNTKEKKSDFTATSRDRLTMDEIGDQ